MSTCRLRRRHEPTAGRHVAGDQRRADVGRRTCSILAPTPSTPSRTTSKPTPTKRAAVLAAEQAGKNRTTLVAWLEDFEA